MVWYHQIEIEKFSVGKFPWWEEEFAVTGDLYGKFPCVYKLIASLFWFIRTMAQA